MIGGVDRIASISPRSGDLFDPRRRSRQAQAPRLGSLDRRHASAALIADMVKAADMIALHLPGILAHWVRHTTNAFLGGLDSVFSAVKRKASGFCSTDNLKTMLYFTAGRLDLPVTL